MTKNNGLKFSLKFEWPLLLLLIGTLIYGAYVYPSLPDKVPSHWNFNGEVDGWSSALWGAFGIPLMNIGLYILFFILPKIDPKKDKYQKFIGAYNAFRYVFHLFFTGLFIITVLSAQGYNIAVDRWVPMGVSVLFIVLGNYMGKIRHNYFVGIKVPWTLASEEVWQKTHRMAGPLWVSAGMVGFISALFRSSIGYVMFFVMLVVAVVVPMIYAYLIYQKVRGQ